MDIEGKLKDIEEELDRPLPERLAKLVVIGLAALLAERLAKYAFETALDKYKDKQNPLQS